MAYRELTMMDVKEVLRRLEAGQSVRRIARETGMDRKTVRRYLEAAQAVRIGPETELSDEVVHEVAQRVQARELPPPSEQRRELAKQEDKLRQWLFERERPLRLTKVHELLGRHGVMVSYSTLRRFVMDELGWSKRPVTVRLADTPPGQEAQADFGKMGMIVDRETGRRRTLWVLVVTLSFSRYQFVWPTFEQTLEAVCEGLDAAWRFFGGMVERLVIDNLSPAVKKADPYHPQLTDGFKDYVQARGLFADPARVRHAQGKARVENQVPYVRESWFDGEELGGLDEARGSAAQWSLLTAGGRVHGTTRKVPREQYETEERAHMKPAPTEPFDVPQWRDATVHPDHHLQVLRALYSVPTRYSGQKVRVRADKRTVRVYLGTECIKTHPRQEPGGRSTDPSDYPKDRAVYAFRNVDELIARAEDKGQYVGAFAYRLLEGPLPWSRMRAAYKLLRLCDKYSAARVDAVCQRALCFDVIDVQRIERMLKSALSTEHDAAERGKLVQLPLPMTRFSRSTDSFRTRRDRDEEGQR